MENIIIIAILFIIIGAITLYLVREKRKGTKCIGCPYAKQCGSHCNGECGQSTIQCNCGCNSK